jgi:hypothetical protein
MSKSFVRLTSVMTLFVSLLAFSGCSDEPPPPTRDEVLVACGDYNVAGCRAFQRCLGWSETEFWSCVNDENARCASDLQAESCWENQYDALERCTASVDDKTCSEVCNNGFCFNQCIYFCPAE